MAFLTASQSCVFRAMETHFLVGESTVLINVFAPIQVPERLFVDTALFIARVNMHIWRGSFTLNMRDGSVSFKQFIDSVNACPPSKEVVFEYINQAFRIYSVYGEELAKVMTGSNADNSVSAEDSK